MGYQKPEGSGTTFVWLVAKNRGGSGPPTRLAFKSVLATMSLSQDYSVFDTIPPQLGNMSAMLHGFLLSNIAISYTDHRKHLSFWKGNIKYLFLPRMCFYSYSVVSLDDWSLNSRPDHQSPA